MIGLLTHGSSKTNITTKLIAANHATSSLDAKLYHELPHSVLGWVAIEMWFYGHDHFPFAFGLRFTRLSDIRSM
jgi:hypothetical protein